MWIFFKMGTTIPVVNNFGTYAVDSIQVYKDANREQSVSEFPYTRCSGVIPSKPGDFPLFKLDMNPLT